MHLGLAMMQTLKPPPPILLHHQPQHSTSLASSLLNSNLAGMENHQMQQQHLPIPLQPHLPNQLGHHLQFSHHAAQQLQHSHQHQSLLLPPTNSHNPQLGLLVNSPSAVSVAAHPSTIIAAGNAAIPSCTVPLQQLTPQSTIPVAIPTVSLPSSQTLNNNSSNNSNNNNNNDNSNNNNNNNSTSNNQPSCSASNGVLIDCPGGGNNDHDEPNPEMVLALISRNRELEATIPKCGGCHELILDRFILKVLERTWHAKCLQCSECHAQLNDKCFARNGQLFCKDDFFKSSNRRYGTKCSACDMGIPPTQVVRRAQDNVYHLQCFLCAICSRTLNTGDEFYLMEDRKLVCKRDYEEAKAKGLYLDGSLDGDQPNKRPRTTITAKQLETLKTAYNNSPKPARHVREQLSQDTGLDMRVVQVWFQNRRAKEKRLKKDAGRTRWSQYFRTMKGNCSPRTEKFLDKDDLKVDYDSFSHHDLSNDSYSTVNLGLDEGASPHSLRGSYMHGSSSPSQYPSSRSPPPAGQNHSFGSYPDNIVYTNVEHNSSTNLHGSKSSSQRLHSGSAVSDMSNDSSPDQGYPDFPPSPDSWLGDAGNNTSNPNPSTPGGVHY